MSYRVAVTETTVIPPNSEQLVSGKLMTKPENEEMGVLEPREIFTRKHPVMVASTTENSSNEIIPITVTNPTLNPVKKHKHTIAAMYRGVSEVVDPQSDENNSCCRHVNSTDASVDINPVPVKMAGKICVPGHLVELWRRTCVDLEETQAIEVARLSQYAGVFAKSPDDLGLTTLVEHQIKLDDASPIKQRVRRKPMLMRRHVEDLRQRGPVSIGPSDMASHCNCDFVFYLVEKTLPSVPHDLPDEEMMIVGLSTSLEVEGLEPYEVYDPPYSDPGLTDEESAVVYPPLLSPKL